MDEFPADDEYDKQCGEIFLTIKGDFIIHCTLCESRYKGFEEYATHFEVMHNSFEAVHLIDDGGGDGSENPDDVGLQFEEVPTLIDPAFHTEIEAEELDGNVISYEFVATETENDIRTVAKRRFKPVKEDRKYNCPHCDFRSNDRSNLMAHTTRHSINKRFLCTECPKTFYTRSELHTHMRSHTGERPYLCPMCGKGFTTSSKLRLHIKRHKNLRDQQCPQCDMKFYTLESLKKHLTVHSDNRPFKCTTCNATFKLQRALDNHMKAHVNSREYKCDLCSADFNLKCNLNAHRKARHGVSTAKNSIKL